MATMSATFHGGYAFVFDQGRTGVTVGTVKTSAPHRQHLLHMIVRAGIPTGMVPTGKSGNYDYYDLSGQNIGVRSDIVFPPVLQLGSKADWSTIPDLGAPKQHPLSLLSTRMPIVQGTLIPSKLGRQARWVDASGYVSPNSILVTVDVGWTLDYVSAVNVHVGTDTVTLSPATSGTKGIELEFIDIYDPPGKVLPDGYVESRDFLMFDALAASPTGKYLIVSPTIQPHSALVPGDSCVPAQFNP